MNTDFLSNRALACNGGFEVHVSGFCLQCITLSEKGSLIVVINIIVSNIIIFYGVVVVVKFVVTIAVIITVSIVIIISTLVHLVHLYYSELCS